MPDTAEKKPKPIIFVIIDAPCNVLGVTAAEKSILTALASHYNAKRSGTEVWPSESRLAELSGLNTRTVRRGLHELQDLEFIKIRPRSGTSNVYSINVEIIRSIADPGHGVRGNVEVIHNPGHGVRTPPDMVSKDPGHGVRQTANRTAKGKSQVRTVSCSSTSKVTGDPKQRELAVLQNINAVAESKRIDYGEQPKIKNNQDVVLPKQARGRDP